MNAIPVISSKPSGVFPGFYEEPRQETDAKIKKAWFYAASGVAMAGAAIAAEAAISTPCMSLLGAAIPLAAASIALAIYSRSLINYADPKTLDSLRQEALSMPLLKIVEKHGWTKIFRYSLMDNARFQEAFRSHAETLPFAAIMGLYHNARNGLNQAMVSARRLDHYSIPLPIEWKDRFEQETAHLRCLDILNGYPVSDLQKFGIITASQKKTLDETSNERDAFNRRHDELEQQFRDATPLQYAALNNACRIAELTYDAHPAHVMLRQIDCEENREKARLDSIRSAMRLELRRLEEARNRLGRPADQLREIDAAVGRLCWQLPETDFYPFHFLKWQARRTDAQRALSLAREIRDQSIAAAREQFRLATGPERRRVDAMHVQNQARIDARLAELDRQYRL